jgi:hypothetical protein
LQAKFIGLYRTASVLFLVCFGIYILFSRQPDYFSSDTAIGTIQNVPLTDTSILHKYKIDTGDYPMVRYAVGGQVYYLNEKDNILAKVGLSGSKVTVIFDADYPEKAAIYKLTGYWIVLDEVIIFLLAYALLFGVAIAVTGKSKIETLEDDELTRQTKYN